MDSLGCLNICHRHLQVVHEVEEFSAVPNFLQNLDEGVDHQDKHQWREGIALDDAILQADITDLLLRPI